MIARYVYLDDITLLATAKIRTIFTQYALCSDYEMCLKRGLAVSAQVR